MKPEITVNEDFFRNVRLENIVELDVRPDIAEGREPFQKIMAQVSALKSFEVLLIIAPFEPVPLVKLLKSRGFESYSDEVEPGTWYTYFKKEMETPETHFSLPHNHNAEFEALIQKFKGKLQEVNVRELEMPQPMVTILQELENLPEDHALYVHHKKVPLFLLPEIEDKGYTYKIWEISDDQVQLLIFRKWNN